jgi:hypothetical protein
VDENAAVLLPLMLMMHTCPSVVQVKSIIFLEMSLGTNFGKVAQLLKTFSCV